MLTVRCLPAEATSKLRSQPATEGPHEPETGPSRFTPQKSDRQQSADQYPEKFVPTNSSVFRAEQFNNHPSSILREAGNLGEVSQNRGEIHFSICFWGLKRLSVSRNIPPCRVFSPWADSVIQTRSEKKLHRRPIIREQPLDQKTEW